MQQRPILYVSNITNLGDARYCAGMGVDLLGFVADPSSHDYVSPALYQEIMGWVSGPGRVIQIASSETALAGYDPEYLHVIRVTDAGQSELPFMLEMPFQASPKDGHFRMSRKPSYLLLTDLPGDATLVHQTLQNFPKEIRILISVPDGVEADDWYLKTGAHGLYLKGSREISPGINDYGRLAEVLEKFD
ncbi:MAG: hypothetical protein JST14_09565 [Bacteroidetes bacterium]|nr:hypothetical protein [Bacteroidota bacterium]